MIKILEEKYNFKARLLELSTKWGDYVNGSWSGTVGDIIRGQANMAICEISIDTHDDTETIDYGTYTFIDQIIFMSQNLALRKNDHLFEHIPMEVLSASGMMFLITSFSLVVITKALYYLGVVPHVRSVGFYLMKMFGIAMKQCKYFVCLYVCLLLTCISFAAIYPIVRIKHDSILIVFCFWMLGFLVLSQLYSWIFYSTITAPEFQKPLDRITELINTLNKSKIDVYVRETSALYQKIVESTEENGIYFMLSRHLNQSSHDMIQTANETIQLLEDNPNSVFLGFKTFAISNRYLQATKFIHISTETLAPAMLGSIYSKHSPFKQAFDLL